jgi:serine/threonine-protein kinase
VTEAKAVNQIGHEHIVDIADFGNTPDGDFYFVMEFLQGEPLSDRLKRDGALPAGRAVAIAMQIADALGASHGQGIIHRDLKPENIFLVHRGGGRDFVKVLDFGLAKLTLGGEERVTHKTRAGSLMGTPFYMSPEQCEGRAEIDHRSDVYSLGVLLFEMLTGMVPFTGEGYGEIIVKHITTPAPSARGLQPGVPAELDLVLYRALAKARDERFQSMADLRDALGDPKGYASGAPTAFIPDDPSGIARLAKPMTRSEIDIRFGRTRLSDDGRPVSGMPSTFRQNVGEILDELTPKKKTSKALIFLAIASLSGATVTGLTSRRGLRRAAPVAAAAPARPAAVRVNFNSDPGGADIIAADGKTMGRTPLSIEIPYSDSATQFTLKKAGFEDKTMYIVPNLPSPLFATLQPVPAPKTVEAAPPPAPPPPARKHRTRAVRQTLDDDAVLAPSFE